MEAKQRKPSLPSRSRHAQARQYGLGLKHTCLRLGPRRQISHNPTEQEAKGVLVGQQQQELGMMPALDDEVGGTCKCIKSNSVFPNDLPMHMRFFCRVARSHDHSVSCLPSAGYTRSGMFLPQVKYDADENSKFYTASPVCTLSRIFSDSSLIQPAWPKVATSPWGEAARVTGGYGERLLNGANSVESPDFMLSKVGGLLVRRITSSAALL